jgi:hypothetical protein
MFGAIGFVWWVALATLLVWWMNYRPGEDTLTVVRSFRYKKNAMKWIRSRERFRGSLILLDSRGDRVIFEREID